MKPHPIIDYPFRWIPMLVLALILVATQVALVCGYTGNDYLPALVDGVATIGWLAAIAYFGLVCGRSCFVVPDGYNHDNRWKPIMAGG